MHTADEPSSHDQAWRRLGPDHYEGVDLVPCTLESLVTWDVSAHARWEQDHLGSVYRPESNAQR
jgi:hypothetical protein